MKLKQHLSVFKYIGKYKRQYLIASIGILLGGMMQVILPWAVGVIVDAVKAQYFDAFYYTKILSSTAALILASYFFMSLASYILDAASAKAVNDLRKNMLHKLLQQSRKYFSRFTIGEFMSRFSDDLTDIRSLFSWGCSSLIQSVFIVGAILAFVVWQIGWWSLLIMSPLFLVYPLTTYLNFKIESSYDALQQASDAINKCVYEAVDSVRLLRAFRMEKYFNKRFGLANDNYYHKSIRRTIYLFMWREIVEFLRLVAVGSMLASGSYLLLTHRITLGQLVSFSIYLDIIMYPMGFFSDLMTSFMTAKAAHKRLDDILEVASELPLGTGTNDADKPASLKTLSCKNLSFTYPDAEVAALSGINFTLHAGETLGIVGRTGAGKSTLLKLLLRLWQAENNAVFLNDKDINAYTPEAYREYLSYVPQDHLLFSKTVKENLLFAKEDADSSELQAALDFADFAADVAAMPSDLETLIGEKGLTLSGGQKQRLALARAVLADKPLLLLDDALSAVDTMTEQRILANLHTRLAQAHDKIGIIVAHRISAVRTADHIIVLDAGKIVESGTHDSLLALNGLYAALYTAQTESKEENI